MNIEIIREGPALPPISEVVIRLTAKEARELRVFFGSLSRSIINSALATRVADVETIYAITNTIFSRLAE